MARTHLDLNGYTDAQVMAALTASGRSYTFEYYLLDRDFQHKAVLEGVSDCSINYTANVRAKYAVNQKAQVNRKASFTIVEDLGDDIDYASDLIRVWFVLNMPDGGVARIPCGTFALTWSSRTRTNNMTQRTVGGNDPMQILIDDLVGYTGQTANGVSFVIKKGTKFTDAIESLLGAFPTISIYESNAVLAVDHVFPVGTSKADILQNLADSLGWDFYFSPYGMPVLAPYTKAADDEPGFTLDESNASLVGDGVTQNVTTPKSIPNTVIGYTAVSTDAGVYWKYRAVNNNANSPTSTVSTGKNVVVTKEFTGPAADTQDSLEKATIKLLDSYSQSVAGTLDCETPILPFANEADCYLVDFPSLGIDNQQVIETSWSYQCQLGSTMSHELRLAIDISTVSGETDDS